mmetsp:Transcript_8814/g.7787  ORF Transcript_8814/g.7787 Transcript_8814/m.7787 type:complete len:188 (+) Transcript_8814:141-704(+)|eukprot:CAMPEP_0114597274 /NCGR_PEP_ID=MMETSP0125-20121206/19520_1 /TAXON_ID=485358 ORGANISM="Aristerostoma sp., Strain ATCC 50986" /NCGR_SAMPLE_ID=MMETSP0125 /ASSEMBLY_ACC=CAM_ASM_000245 /LENGTH=187 /DNA_ID=CAMNT_0001801593 /DNA_START=52 /DNA_END=615 /DNA_ORIENTATION=-
MNEPQEIINFAQTSVKNKIPLKIDDSGKRQKLKTNEKYFLPSEDISEKEFIETFVKRTAKESDQMDDLENAFRRHFLAISQSINKVLKEKEKDKDMQTGVKEVLMEYQKYAKQYQDGYKQAGFEGRDLNYSTLQLIINLAKRKDEHFAKSGQTTMKDLVSQSTNQDAILREFFEDEVWNDTSLMELE